MASFCNYMYCYIHQEHELIHIIVEVKYIGVLYARIKIYHDY